MKLSTSDLQYIEKVISVADTVGLDSIIIEPDRVRATSDSGEVFILHTAGVPDMPFGSIGINRTSIFKARYSVVKPLNTVYEASVSTVTIDGAPVQFARAISMKAPRVSVDYRCANPMTIKSPKKVLDPTKCEIITNAEWVESLAKAQQAMSSDTVDLLFDGDGTLSFVVKDVNGDAFDFIIDDAFDVGGTGEFEHTYHTKVLLPILRKLSNPLIEITNLGMIKASVNNFDVYLKPVVQ